MCYGVLQDYAQGSILYVSETYYNLTGTQLRNTELIEKGYSRKILKTYKGCPTVQLYLETGQWPANQKDTVTIFEINSGRRRNSMNIKFINLQLQEPTKGE